MEKLQVAIEKARAQREEARQNVAQNPAEEQLIETPGDVWAELPSFDLKPRVVRKNLLVSYNAGEDAGPFDMLRTRIIQHATKNSWRRVALVSPQKGSGKSTTTANLAFSFGRQRDKKTLVLDLDLRRCGLSRILGQKCKHSMATVLQREIEFSEHGLRFGDNVAFGLNNGPIGNSSEILQSNRARESLDEIDNCFNPDIVLFDLPPLLGADDTFGFLKNVDCALLIAEADKTTIAQIDVAERQLAELTNVMGVVLNKSRYLGNDDGYEYSNG